MKKAEGSVSIIVPCYNEEGNVPDIVPRIPRFLKDIEVVFVNDGSVDRTLEAMRAAKARAKGVKVRIVSYPKNQGKGYASHRGMRAATGDVLVILDADLTSPPEELPKVVMPIIEGPADFVNGSRFSYRMEEGAMSGLHNFGNRMFAMIVNLMLGTKFTDTLCGFKALKRGDYRHMKMVERSWPDFDLIIQARKLGLRIVEVPIHYKARVAGKSKMKSFSHSVKMLTGIFRSYFGFRPRR